MPIIKRAIKKLRHDRKIMVTNAKKRMDLRAVVKTYRKQPTAKKLSSVFTSLDKASKTNLIHKNKAARLKSRLAKLLKKA